MQSGIVTHYRIIDQIGSGGMGEVYKAVDLNLNRTVALKFLPQNFNVNPDLRKRLVNEAKTASALEHINICSIYGIEETKDGQLFIAMAYYEGATLKEKLSKKKIDFKEAIDIIFQIAEGLLKAHEKKIVHRDIKPDNIFITIDGQIKILDFGLAKNIEQTQITRLNATPGTAAYMSPEQIKGEDLNNQTDIWSLGVVFYELLTGEKPFKSDSDPAIIYSILNEEPKQLNFYLQESSDTLQQIINKLLCKDKAKRYSNLSEVIIDLKKLIGQKITFRKKIRYKKSVLKKASIVLTLIISVVLTYLLWNNLWSKAPPVLTKIPIAVISFENQTGDSTYDYLQNVIPNLLINNLEQTNYFEIVTWERLKDLANQIKIPNTNYIDKSIGFELCKKENINKIVLGSFTKAGNDFITNVKVINTNDKKLLTGVITKGNGIESIILKQVDEITKEISSNLGLLKLGDIENLKAVSDLTTKSIEAYNFYLKGNAELYKLNWENSKNLFLKALEIDSTFAIAYTHLAISYSYLNNDKEMKHAINIAMNLSNKVSEKERRIIEAQYAILVENDLNKFTRIYESLASQFPKEKWFHICLAFGYSKQGKLKDAIKERKLVLELYPDQPNTLNTIGYDYIKLGDYERALNYFNRLKEVCPGDPNPLDSMGDLFLLKGNLDNAYSYYIQAYDLSKEFGVQLKLAYLFALKENFKESLRWIDKRIESAPSDGDKSIAYLWRGFINYLISNNQQSNEDFKFSERLAKNVNSKLILGNLYYILAWLDLEKNDIKVGQVYMDKFINWRKSVSMEIPPEIQLDYEIYRNWSLLFSNNKTASEINQEVIDNIIRQVAGPDSIRLSNLYNAYKAEYYFLNQNFSKALEYKRINYQPEFNLNLRLIKYNLPTQIDFAAKSYAAMGQVDNAIKEYKELLNYYPDHKAIRIPNPVYHYRLGVLYEQKGLKENAIKEYQLFIKIHKEFEITFPQIVDAKNRLQILIKEKDRTNYGQL